MSVAETCKYLSSPAQILLIFVSSNPDQFSCLGRAWVNGHLQMQVNSASSPDCPLEVWWPICSHLGFRAELARRAL